MIPTVCSAEEWSRKGKVEWFVLAQSMNGAKTTGLGVTLEFGNSTAWGVGIGINFSDNFSLNLESLFTSKDWVFERGSYRDRGSVRFSFGNIGLEVNIFKSQFTPIISGGIGVIEFIRGWEKHIVEWLLEGQQYVFSYNVGGGFRWDVTNHFNIKFIYRATWTKMKDTNKLVLFDGIALSIGLYWLQL